MKVHSTALYEISCHYWRRAYQSTLVHFWKIQQQGYTSWSVTQLNQVLTVYSYNSSNLSVILSKPVYERIENHGNKYNSCIIHRILINWHWEWETEKDPGKSGPTDCYNVGEKTKLTQPERTVLDVVSSLVQETNWSGIWQQQECDTASNHGIVRRCEPHVNTTNNSTPEARHRAPCLLPNAW